MTGITRTSDQDGPQWDPFLYAINSTTTQLTDDGGPNTQSGSVALSLQAGDEFCFGANSIDQQFGAATTTITEFTVIPVVIVSASSSGSWSAPASVTEITVEVWGGGGGGRNRRHR